MNSEGHKLIEKQTVDAIEIEHTLEQFIDFYSMRIVRIATE